MKNRQHLMILLSLLLVFVLALAACGGEPAAEEPVEESSPAEAGEPVAERVETGTNTPTETPEPTATATLEATGADEATEVAEANEIDETTETDEKVINLEEDRFYIASNLTEEQRAYLEQLWKEGRLIQILTLNARSLRIDNPPFGTELVKFMRGEDSYMYPKDVAILVVELDESQSELIHWEGDISGVAIIKRDNIGLVINATPTLRFNPEKNDYRGDNVSLYQRLLLYKPQIKYFIVPNPLNFKIDPNNQNEQAEQVEEPGQDNEQVEDQEHGNEQAEQEQSQEQSEEPAHPSITP